jgi:hypothetical protein
MTGALGPVQSSPLHAGGGEATRRQRVQGQAGTYGFLDTTACTALRDAVPVELVAASKNKPRSLENRS